MKITIEMYDPKIKEPPLKFITLKEIEEEIDFDQMDGNERYHFLRRTATENGYTFRFYSGDTKHIKIVVQNPDPNQNKCLNCGCDIDCIQSFCKSCKFQIETMAKIMEGS